MTHVRTALFLDFDNVFGGLHKIDPEAAIEFAENPGSWLSALESSFTVTGPRRWLVLRCYLNPAGWVASPGAEGQPRLYFSRFRPAFTQAGFEVIDCPRLSFTKNAADIRMVLDAVDASTVVPGYEEFVIASGDSDMTPLLVRLRAADRRTTIFSPSDAAEAFTSVADCLIGADDVLALIQGDLDTELEAEPRREGGAAPVPDQHRALSGEPGGALSRARAIVVERYAKAYEPLNLSRLASEIQDELADTEETGVVRRTRWFGAGSFGQFLLGLRLPNMKLSQHFLWDGTRHTAPHDRKSETVDVSSPVERLNAAFNLPGLAQEAWSPVFEALADYAGTHDFRLAEATRWGRDRLAERDIAVSRQAVGLVTRAAAFGGAPLHEKPPPTAEKIGAAFVANLLKRADAAGITLTAEESDAVRAWFGWQP